MEYYYIEVSIEDSCNCGYLMEAFLVLAENKTEALEKLKSKLRRSKNKVISRVYRCSDLKNGVYLIYAKGR